MPEITATDILRDAGLSQLKDETIKKAEEIIRLQIAANELLGKAAIGLAAAKSWTAKYDKGYTKTLLAKYLDDMLLAYAWYGKIDALWKEIKGDN
jgi:hypothetical protein